jgi:hypothetical protein
MGGSALARSDSRQDRERMMSFHCFAFGSRSLEMRHASVAKRHMSAGMPTERLGEYLPHQLKDPV